MSSTEVQAEMLHGSLDDALKEAWIAGYHAALEDKAVSEEEDEIAESLARSAYERQHTEPLRQR